MKTAKSYRIHPGNRKAPVMLDQTVWLAALTLLVIGYIMLYFIYPMFSKGLLF
ncbi:hypothetical protein Runsl_4618 [Runella slithyformis DSM 19594]|uniref:Uncharacterized protein n=1 Tax=Runella slithyformis (strain ATCC 29530 / DSM 19594 / LMG 11500 / NCIMB 11436 / LSU 4) TaxID=761193 RepID=A0A7U4E831_RUNSL|nr:hypothetical protein Runsl_4618 [Runella slithyformis DSM 19594]